VTTNVSNGSGGFVPVDDGTPVTLTTSLGTWATTGAQVLTVGTVAGVAQASLKAGVRSGTAQILATAGSASGAGSLTLQPVTFMITNSAIPTSLIATGLTTSIITVTVTTSTGQPVPFLTVDFTADIGLVIPSETTTDATGKVTAVYNPGSITTLNTTSQFIASVMVSVPDISLSTVQEIVVTTVAVKPTAAPPPQH